MQTRPTHRVSVKAALLDETTQRALMTITPDGGFGLPGGHVEYNESPDTAIRRELQEELGLGEIGALKQRGFWREVDGDRIILGYVGKFSETTIITIDPDEIAGTVWVSKEDLLKGSVYSKTYNDYLMEVLTKKHSL